MKVEKIRKAEEELSEAISLLVARHREATGEMVEDLKVNWLGAIGGDFGPTVNTYPKRRVTY